MKNNLLKKLTEALISVLPVSLIVIVLGITPLVGFSAYEIVVFIECSLLLVVGMGLFNLGADMAMTPIGSHVGSGLTKSKKLWLLLLSCFAMGVVITIAEPDLSVLASYVEGMIDGTTLIITVGVGVGTLLVVAVLKMVFKKQLSHVLTFFYTLLFCLTSLLILSGKEGFLALAFDSGGVTTGPITVPFIMALGLGIASVIGGKDVRENSFGLIALCSVGPIIAVMFLGLSSSGAPSYTLGEYAVPTEFFSAFGTALLHTCKSVGIALGLIVLFFLVLQFTVLKLPKQKLIKIAFGILYTFAGLVIFLTTVEIGFVPIGYKLGVALSSLPSIVIVLIAFVIGLAVVLAEPAIHVLNKQVEEITNGTVSKRSMMIALCVGVGLALALSMLRIIYDFNILYILIPGYVISLGLSFFVPAIYTGIAFDSGGVASGPLTSSFILPLAIGVCASLQGEAQILSNAFGVVALVAMTPLITIQLLGFKAIITKKIKEKAAMQRILSADDKQIIDFM